MCSRLQNLEWNTNFPMAFWDVNVASILYLLYSASFMITVIVDNWLGPQSLTRCYSSLESLNRHHKMKLKKDHFTCYSVLIVNQIFFQAELSIYIFTFINGSFMFILITNYSRNIAWHRIHLHNLGRILNHSQNSNHLVCFQREVGKLRR